MIDGPPSNSGEDNPDSPELSRPSSEADILATDPRAILSPLFRRAKEVDEFEFCCTLLRIRGIEGAGWDPLRESDALARQLIGLINAPIDQGLRLRLSLFLYSHLTEMDDLYNIVANLLRVILGERCLMAPFRALPKVTGKLPQGDPANQSIKQLVTLSQQAGFPEIGLLFQTMFLRPVRNAFYHSDYILTGESFNIRWGEGVKIGSMISSQVRLDWLLERVNLGINTALSTLELLLEHIRSYRESKIVKGRLAADGSWVDVELFTDPSFGLTGFQTPPRPKPHPTEETERDLGSKTRSESPTRERSTPDFDLS